MTQHEPLYPDQYYHVFGRGINGTPLFYHEHNYSYFLELYAKYIAPIAKTYAYCLLNNHYHFCVAMRPITSNQDYDERVKHNSLQFRNLFSTYTKAINKEQHRTGGLFESPFRRKRVDNDSYFTTLVSYIHQNPQKHRFVDDFRQWKYFSYHAIVGNRPTQVERGEVLSWFGSQEQFIEAHQTNVDLSKIEDLIDRDFL